MQRPVDAPDQVWSDKDQAAAWLGFKVDEFLAEAAAHPRLLPRTRKGKAYKWHWMDLVCYSHVTRDAAQASAPVPARKRKGEGP